ncbi:MAG TPA: XdhC family protein [Polyangiaceae bacterium]|jgi:xanthine dehydrogenase accessory factor
MQSLTTTALSSPTGVDLPAPLVPANADPLAAAVALRSRGVPFVLATVVRAVAPTSAKPGDKALLTERGVLVGWVGGSCAEPIVRKESAAALRDGECRLLHITPEPDAPADRPGLSVHEMTCYSGGALEIYLEPYLPMPTLLVFGNSPVARALCDLGRVMKYRVLLCDLGERPSMADELDVVRDLDKLPELDPASTYGVVASHGVFDDDSLEKVVELGLPYMGFVTSRKRRDEVFAALEARGVAADRLARVTAPAGLDLGARLPQEVAVSVMAQIVSVRRAGKGAAVAVMPPVQAKASPSRSLAAGPPGASPHESCCHGPSGKSE